MRIKITAAFAVVLLVFTAAPALATVTFDPTTGTGFVGKGDLQVPWGWNNQTLQKQAANVTFSYARSDATDYTVTCEWDTVTGGKTQTTIHHVVTNTKAVSDTVAYDVSSTSRKNSQGTVTGFNLKGFGSSIVTTSGDPVPSVGDTCPNGGGGIVTAVDLLASSSSGGLSASDANAGTGPTLIWSLVP
ncbi:MAG: hypothetical protein HYU87_04970 [Chloroflexi bacterium]|nr:hypothetical protein [Chloroflexota bacterium]